VFACYLVLKSIPLDGNSKAGHRNVLSRVGGQQRKPCSDVM